MVSWIICCTSSNTVRAAPTFTISMYANTLWMEPFEATTGITANNHVIGFGSSTNTPCMLVICCCCSLGGPFFCKIKFNILFKCCTILCNVYVTNFACIREKTPMTFIGYWCWTLCLPWRFFRLVAAFRAPACLLSSTPSRWSNHIWTSSVLRRVFLASCSTSRSFASRPSLCTYQYKQVLRGSASWAHNRWNKVAFTFLHVSIQVLQENSSVSNLNSRAWITLQRARLNRFVTNKESKANINLHSSTYKQCCYNWFK